MLETAQNSEFGTSRRYLSKLLWVRKVVYIVKVRGNHFFRSNKAPNGFPKGLSDRKFSGEQESAQKNPHFYFCHERPLLAKVDTKKPEIRPFLCQIKLPRGKVGSKMPFLAFPGPENGQKRSKNVTRFLAPGGVWTGELRQKKSLKSCALNHCAREALWVSLVKNQLITPAPANS